MLLKPIIIVTIAISGLISLIFRGEISSKGHFSLCVSTLTISLVFTLLELNYNFSLNVYHYLDLGTFIKINEVFESKFLFCFDSLSYICSAIVIVLTIIAQLFGVEYMAREAHSIRLSYLLNLFASSVITLFSVYDVFLLFCVWELIAYLSYLLVSYYTHKIHITKSAFKVIYFSRISDIFIFLIFIFSVRIFGSTDMSLIFFKAPYFYNHNTIFLLCKFEKLDKYILMIVNSLTLIGFLVAMASFIKSAQICFHVWLPDAMFAPTPASSLIHSSTLVVIGIYLTVRFSIIFEFTMYVNLMYVLVGSFTIAYGSVCAFFQNDIKKLVAYSTISQIGYLICGCGFLAFEEVILYLIIHAINKAFLFVVVGYTVHFYSSNTDMRQMSNLHIYGLDITLFIFITFLGLTGLPYFLGFYAKEFLLYKIFLEDFFCIYIVRCMWIISFIFTPMYMFSLMYIVSYKINKDIINFYKNNIKHCNYLVVYFLHNSFVGNISKYQIIIIISRITSLILTNYIIFFNFFGESLIFIIFNFLSNDDFIEYNFFMNICFNMSKDNIHNFFVYRLNVTLIFLVFFLFFNSIFYKIGFNNKSINKIIVNGVIYDVYSFICCNIYLIFIGL